MKTWDTTASDWDDETGTTPFLTAAEVSGTYVAQDSQVISVRDHGAVGDGVADDLAAIHAAIAALPSNGGVVLFPPGEYAISDSIIIDADRVTLRGMTHGWWEEFIYDDPGTSNEGPGVSKIKALATGFNLIEIHNSGLLARRCGLGVEKLYLVGEDYSSWAIWSHDDAAEQETLNVEQTFIHKTGGGISVKSDSMRVNKCHIMDIGTSPAIELRTGWFASITDNTIADNSGVGISIPSMHGPIITGNVFARITSAVVMADIAAPIIRGNQFYANRDDDIVLDSTNNFDVSGNQFFIGGADKSAIVIGATTACAGGVIEGNTIRQFGVANASRPIHVGTTSTGVRVAENSIVATNGGSWPITAARSDKKVRTAGHVVLNGTAWATIDTGLDIVLFGVVGDWVRVEVAGLWNNDAVYSEIDARSWVSGAAVNSWAFDAAAAAGGNGVMSWKGISGQYMPIGGSIMRKLTADDLVNNTVTIRLRARTATAANKSLFASASDPFTVMAVNLGQG